MTANPSFPNLMMPSIATHTNLATHLIITHDAKERKTKRDETKGKKQ